MTSTSQAIEKAETGAKALIQQYADSFAAVLPSHIENPDTWLRLAQGALKKGKRGNDGKYELEVAANNNVPVLLATLLDCARLGLEPGTEQYYLTPRRVKKPGGGYQTEILGIIGYQGIVELIFRAGAVSSVIAECVFTQDRFEYAPGQQERPLHEIDWDLDDRGDLRLTYAYAVMKDGATSKVVVLNRADMARIKAKAQGADSQYSPWQTDEPAMWLKSAVRQLRKWVPTSSEYIRERLRQGGRDPVLPAAELPEDLPAINSEQDWDDDDPGRPFEVDDEPVDAEIVA